MLQNKLVTRLEGALPKQATSDISSARNKREIEIVEQARNLLAEQGYSKFSMRGVAASMGISLRTVQHYYPTKRDLLSETVKYTLVHYYHEQFHILFEENETKDPTEKFLIMIDYMLEDVRNPFSIKFFTELWALSLRDLDASIAMDTIYTLHRQNIEQLIVEINPNLSASRSSHRATIVIALIEGLMLMLGDGKPHHSELDGIDQEVRKRILDIVMMPED
ncbi:MAG: TetR/AcrR family transcriptional regulator [Porticoccaceae bacterium]|nr:TetR/AcrR family transcriptional regulator [Porticoccaceae bacterium]